MRGWWCVGCLPDCGNARLDQDRFTCIASRALTEDAIASTVESFFARRPGPEQPDDPGPRIPQPEEPVTTPPGPETPGTGDPNLPPADPDPEPNPGPDPAPPKGPGYSV